MDFSKISEIKLIPFSIAALFYCFLIPGNWYKIFGKEFAKAVGLKMEDIQRKYTNIKKAQTMLFSFISRLIYIFSFFLMINMLHLTTLF